MIRTPPALLAAGLLAAAAPALGQPSVEDSEARGAPADQVVIAVDDRGRPLL